MRYKYCKNCKEWIEIDRWNTNQLFPQCSDCGKQLEGTINTKVVNDVIFSGENSIKVAKEAGLVEDCKPVRLY